VGCNRKRESRATQLEYLTDNYSGGEIKSGGTGGGKVVLLLLLLLLGLLREWCCRRELCQVSGGQDRRACTTDSLTSSTRVELCAGGAVGRHASCDDRQQDDVSERAGGGRGAVR